MKVKHLAFTIASTCCITLNLNAKVKLPELFSNNMILQQESETPLWGEAKAGKNLQVKTSWDNKTYSTVVGSDGKWKINISTPSFGGPYTIEISDGSKVKLENVMIGEVWVCSGQSNMEMPLAGWGRIDNYKKEIAEANYSDIRLFHVKKVTENKPSETVISENAGWMNCNSENIAEFSSVAYFFGRDIHLSKGVPVGLINVSWGGTIAEAWTSSDMLCTMPDFIDKVKEVERKAAIEKTPVSNINEQLKQWEKNLFNLDPGVENNKPLWTSLNFDDSNWKEMKIREIWEDKYLPNYDGIVWMRKTINIPKDWSNKDLTLDLGCIDDDDITYFNGVEIGRSNGWNLVRQYKVPGKLVKEGKAVITVRVYDSGQGGGLYDQTTNQALVLSPDNKIDITGEWKYNASLASNKIPSQPAVNDSPNRTTVLYNGMLSPIIPFKIKGAIWYQGESNASRAYQYRELFPLMIKDWRNKWNDNFPFYYVQLANFKEELSEPANSDWAELREAQLMTLNLENTGMAVTIDIGDAKDIHPKNKQEVGRRLALIAKANVYNENVEYSGPIYDSYKIEGNKIRIKFKHSDKGLKTSDNKHVKGFQIAGNDHKFFWADAVIEGNDVLVYCNEVPNPMAVRYAWANNPVCNLYNSDNLPASPFRTDDWPGITINNK